MHRRNIVGIAAAVALGFALVPGGAIAQQKSIKDQLVGAWTLLLDDGVKADGTHVPNFGPNPVGTLMFSPTGRYSLQIMRVINRAPFASKNRDTGTAEENKAVSQGTISHFGTYTVDEAGKTINFRVEGSSFPNWEGTIQKRPVTAVTDEVLTYTNPNTTTPGQGFTGGELAWKKVK